MPSSPKPRSNSLGPRPHARPRAIRLTAIPEYHVYRGELDLALRRRRSQRTCPRTNGNRRSTLLARSQTASYRDIAFDFGKTYALYRSQRHRLPEETRWNLVIRDPAIVTAADTFPPAVPQGLVAARHCRRATPAQPKSISPGPSIRKPIWPAIASIAVSSKDAQGRAGDPRLLLSPAYRDTSVQPGHRYWYPVTAVDRSGNESAPSSAVAADVAQPSP